MNDIVETLKLLANMVMKEEHAVLDKHMTEDQKIDYVNSVSTLNEHSRHIQSLMD